MFFETPAFVFRRDEFLLLPLKVLDVAEYDPCFSSHALRVEIPSSPGHLSGRPYTSYAPVLVPRVHSRTHLQGEIAPLVSHLSFDRHWFGSFFVFFSFGTLVIFRTVGLSPG